jgi:hypothetical protein
MTILLGILLLFVATPGAGAQQHGNLQVTIMDPDGNRLPEAQIAVRLDGRELSRATANDEGIAVVSDIPSATYEVLIEKEGFHSCSRTIFVDTQGAAVEVTLLPKPTKSEQVEVHARAGLPNDLRLELLDLLHRLDKLLGLHNFSPIPIISPEGPMSKGHMEGQSVPDLTRLEV